MQTLLLLDVHLVAYVLARKTTPWLAGPLPLQAVLCLLAHAYTVYLLHLTSGGRIAAAAAQRLQLPACDALAFYR